MRARAATFPKEHRDYSGDFRCAHCHVVVSSAHFLSGVNNRNHCPYCLWSRHLDLFTAGDRLSACKGQMKPVGLTMKHGRNKYRLGQRGELMLIHECSECKSLSINRIAADDDPVAIITVFQESTEDQMYRICEARGILMLKSHDSDVLYKQLYGCLEIPVKVW
jgi:hypothetical protein